MKEKKNASENSIKSVFIDIFFDSTHIASATGFIVNDNCEYYLVTNRHVVTGRNNETNECLDEINKSIPNKIVVSLPYYDGEVVAWNKVEIKLYNENEEKIWFEHPAFGPKVDVVLIKLKKYNQRNLCYNLNSNPATYVTQNVFIIGYPYGFNVNPNLGKYAIWTTGIIASDPDLDLNIADEQLPAFLVDAKTRKGQSGSPVIYYNNNGIYFNENGFAIYDSPISYEIGIYSGRINKDSDLGYVWKWSIIKEIIDSI